MQPRVANNAYGDLPPPRVAGDLGPLTQLADVHVRLLGSLDYASPRCAVREGDEIGQSQSAWPPPLLREETRASS